MLAVCRCVWCIIHGVVCLAQLLSSWCACQAIQQGTSVPEGCHPLDVVASKRACAASMLSAFALWKGGWCVIGKGDVVGLMT